MLIWADAVRTKKGGETGESERAGRRQTERANGPVKGRAPFGSSKGVQRAGAAPVDRRTRGRGGILNRTQEKVADLVVDSLSLREPVPSFTPPITNLPVAATLVEVAWLHGGVSVSNFIESSPRFTYKVCGVMPGCWELEIFIPIFNLLFQAASI